MLRGYLIRLTREYTDGGMDSHADEEKGITQVKMSVTVIKRRIAVFALKHEAILSTNREEPKKQYEKQ